PGDVGAFPDKPALPRRYSRQGPVLRTLRLLEDFLQHVMREAALVSHRSLLRFRYPISLPATTVFLTSPEGVSAMKSATTPIFRKPLSSRPVVRAGFAVAAHSASRRSHSPKFMALRTARSRVRVLPARTPFARQRPSAT